MILPCPDGWSRAEVPHPDGDAGWLVDVGPEPDSINAAFLVYQVTEWESGTRAPCAAAQVWRGQVRWDGCTDVWGTAPNGYLHTCDERVLAGIGRVWLAVYRAAWRVIRGAEMAVPPHCPQCGRLGEVEPFDVCAACYAEAFEAAARGEAADIVQPWPGGGE